MIMIKNKCDNNLVVKGTKVYPTNFNVMFVQVKDEENPYMEFRTKGGLMKINKVENAQSGEDQKFENAYSVGKVVAVGPLTETMSVGDLILYAKMYMMPATLCGEQYYTCAEQNIFCAMKTQESIDIKEKQNSKEKKDKEKEEGKLMLKVLETLKELKSQTK